MQDILCTRVLYNDSSLLAGSGLEQVLYIYIYIDYVQILAGGKKETGIEVAGESATVR